MRKVTKSYSFRGPSAKLYREDIEYVLSVLSDNCERVTISDNNYEYDSLEDLEKQKGKSPKTLKLSGHNPHACLELCKGLTCSIHLYGEGTEGVALIIRELLKSRRTIASRVFSTYTLVLYTVIVFVFITFLTLSRSPYFWLPAALLIILVPLSYLTVHVDQGGLYSINLHRRHEPSTFWARNKDTIVVSIVVAVVTWAITYFTSK